MGRQVQASISETRLSISVTELDQTISGGSQFFKSFLTHAESDVITAEGEYLDVVATKGSDWVKVARIFDKQGFEAFGRQTEADAINFFTFPWSIPS